MSAHHIVTLPGDGIGPEIMAPTLQLLQALGEFEFEEHLFGGAAIDAHGTALTDETLAACRKSDAVLLAAVGGPKWDTTDPNQPRPEQGLLGLRKGLGLYANLRPVKPLPALYPASPLRGEVIEGTDLLVVRELTGGHLLRREDPHGDHRLRPLRLLDRGDRADRAHRVSGGRRPGGRRRGKGPEGLQRRQGERAGDLAAVARGRHPAARARVRGRGARAPCSSTTPRCSSSPTPATST